MKIYYNKINKMKLYNKIKVKIYKINKRIKNIFNSFYIIRLNKNNIIRYNKMKFLKQKIKYNKVKIYFNIMKMKFKIMKVKRKIPIHM